MAVRIVILGAGFAGLAAARALGNSPADVIIVDRQNHHVFQPLLYQVATAALSAPDIAQPVRHILRRFENIQVLRGEVHGIDTQHRRVRLDAQSVPYDILVVATGAITNFFGHDEWAMFAPGLKTLPDAQRVRSRVLDCFETAEACDDPDEQRRLMTFAVIGGGPTGVELAGSIAELARHTLAGEFRNIRPHDAQVLLFEAGPRILSSFPEDLAAYAADELGRLGVNVRVGAPIAEVSAGGLTVAGSFTPAATIVWAAGVTSSPVGAWLGLPTDNIGRVAVMGDLSVVDHPEIYVLGDAALVRDRNGDPLPGLAQVARQEGQYLGRALRARLQGDRPKPFRYRNFGSWAIVGRNVAIAKFDSVRLRGRVAWIAWGLIHIALLVGFENRVRVLLKWFWEYLTRRRGARLIVYGPAHAVSSPPLASEMPVQDPEVPVSGMDGEGRGR